MGTRPNNIGINIQGAVSDKHAETVSVIAASIASLMHVAHEAHMDQATVQTALKVLRDLSPDGSVSDVTVSGATVRMEQSE